MVIAAPRVSLSYRLAKNKVILRRKGQRKFLVWEKRKEGRKETKIPKSSVRSPNALAKFRWLFLWRGQIAGRMRKAVGN